MSRGAHFASGARRRRVRVRVAGALLILAVLAGGAFAVQHYRHSNAGQTATKVTGAATTTSSTAPTTSLSGLPAPVVGTDSITYTLPAGTTVVISASGACWVQVRDTATSPVRRDVTLKAGEHLSLSTPAWIRFGDPTNATATMGSSTLRLPALSGQLVVVSSP
jgi:hypothetical protein